VATDLQWRDEVRSLLAQKGRQFHALCESALRPAGRRNNQNIHEFLAADASIVTGSDSSRLDDYFGARVNYVHSGTTQC